MIYVISEATNSVVNSCDAWWTGGVEAMEQWAVENGYTISAEIIDSMGNMQIWVI